MIQDRNNPDRDNLGENPLYQKVEAATEAGNFQELRDIVQDPDESLGVRALAFTGLLSSLGTKKEYLLKELVDRVEVDNSLADLKDFVEDTTRPLENLWGMSIKREEDIDFLIETAVTPETNGIARSHALVILATYQDILCGQGKIDSALSIKIANGLEEGSRIEQQYLEKDMSDFFFRRDDE